MNPTLSIVTACFNDHHNLASTLASMREELNDRDELVIVDSSTDHELARGLAGSIGLSCSQRYIWMPPKGVYAAQNAGIKESTGDWIQIINSGDRLCPGARQEIDTALKTLPTVKVHVFRARAFAPNVASYIFSPTATSAWPHQSIIVHRSVYEQEGMYSEECRYAADQTYFARVRHSQEWQLHSALLTEFLLGGLTSGVSFSHLCEVYVARRALGQSCVRGMIGSFALPVVRKLFEKTVGQRMVIKLKCRLFSYYRPG
jgi:glycosyltransferase involved in cell wall biosynthesis